MRRPLFIGTSILLLMIAISAYFAVRGRDLRQQTTLVAAETSSSRAPAADPSVPPKDDKVRIVRSYYDDVTAGRFPDAFDRLSPGFYTSPEALGSAYDGAHIELTDAQDVPNSRDLDVTIVGHARTGATTTYRGRISFAYDEHKGRWLIDHRALTASTVRPTDTPAAQTPAREPVRAVAAAASQPGRIELADVSDQVGYVLSGSGDGIIATMQLRVVNTSERTWIVHVKKGTRLEPDDSSVQSMVVTEDVELEIEPHDENKIDVQVACLDIAKDPPPAAADGVRWSVSAMPQAADYITCTGLSPDNGLQYAIWLARGASSDDLAKHFHDLGKSDEESAQLADVFLSKFQPVARRCGSLT